MREREKERAGHCVLVQYCKKKNTNGIIFNSGFLGCIQPCFPLTWTIHDIGMELGLHVPNTDH